MKDIPVLERQVSAQTSGSTPNFGDAMNALAESQNSLSAIGAKVAQTSSNALAEKLGYETGKNPKGDLMPSFTEFDKHFADSYHQQANAVLSLQGQKLLDDVQVQLAQANRLTPGLIANANQQLQTGLSKISENAPTAIKGKLEASFASSMLEVNKHNQLKLIGEQREDQKNNLDASIALSQKQALEFGQSGNTKGSESARDAAISASANALANNYISKKQHDTNVETAHQNYINGKYLNLSDQAYKEGKQAEFDAEFAKGPPKGMTHEQWMNAGRAIITQQNFTQTLRAQDENLKTQQMINRIATDVGGITGSEWQSFADSVSKIRAEEVKFKYIQALKKNDSGKASEDVIIKEWGNPEAHANSTPKARDKAFNRLVDYSVENTKNTGTPLTHDQAQVQVAASAGAPIPVFTNDLKNKLSSANPAFLESAAQQIHSLQAMGAGHALSGLDAQDLARYATYESLRNSTDPVTAARETANIGNQDPAVQQMNKQKWSNFLTAKTSGGIQLDDFALSSVGFKKSDFVTPSMAQVYGTDILKKYSTFFQLLNGDANNALKLTKQFVDENYGDTGVNGGTNKTLHPLEKVLGFEDKHAVPYIQQDVINQFNEKLLPIKEAYSKKETNEYWETEPLNKKAKGVFSTYYDPIKVKRHMRTDKGEKVDTFNVILQGNAFDNWDVAVQTDSGMRNLFQIAPYLGITSYVPNKKAIRESYDKDNNLK